MIIVTLFDQEQWAHESVGPFATRQEAADWAMAKAMSLLADDLVFAEVADGYIRLAFKDNPEDNGDGYELFIKELHLPSAEMPATRVG
jgi:hypothetical protein